MKGLLPLPTIGPSENGFIGLAADATVFTAGLAAWADELLGMPLFRRRLGTTAPNGSMIPTLPANVSRLVKPNSDVRLFVRLYK